MRQAHYRRTSDRSGSLPAGRGLLTTLIANKKPKEALVEIERLKQRTDFYGVLDFELARVNQLTKKYDDALTYLKALKRDPANVSIMKYAALTEYTRGDKAEAGHLSRRSSPSNQMHGIVPPWAPRLPKQADGASGSNVLKVLEHSKQHQGTLLESSCTGVAAWVWVSMRRAPNTRSLQKQLIRTPS